ncbi:hypothetical protein Bhyg_05590 [Pseudolycoriella hygida]|uniref:Uncharacterized protein n=1 Tax=Pseudolycoriella hygida TaxID=35572 RepID=A0A9Q0N180_9DIPT|nr:hypothetical protein Bhyg_05590 [Pseudolycoriella hygida]
MMNNMYDQQMQGTLPIIQDPTMHTLNAASTMMQAPVNSSFIGPLTPLQMLAMKEQQISHLMQRVQVDRVGLRSLLV